jgi:hypothetical protein
MVRRVKPKARETPKNPIPIWILSGAPVINPAASTALPQPPKTSQKVPINSATTFLANGIVASPLVSYLV